MTQDTKAIEEVQQDSATDADATTRDAPVRKLARTTGGQTLFDRFISPVVLPIASVGAIIFVVLNISRVLLAGTGGGHAEEGAEKAGHAILPVLIAATITIAILVFAATFSTARKMRRHTLAVFAAVALGAVSFAGWLSVGDAQEKVAEAAGVPCDTPTQTLTIDGTNDFSFVLDAESVPGGCLEISFGGAAGHTLVFESSPAPFPKFSGLGSKSFEIAPGEYEIKCDVGSHADLGMKATFTVTGDGVTSEAPTEAHA